MSPTTQDEQAAEEFAQKRFHTGLFSRDELRIAATGHIAGQRHKQKQILELLRSEESGRAMMLRLVADHIETRLAEKEKEGKRDEDKVL